MPTEIQNVIDRVDRSWPKDYMIRFLYVNLAPYFERDLYFFLATYEDKLAQFKAGFHKRGTKIVCSTLADYYIEVFAMFNINVRKIIATSAEIPLFALIVEGEKGWFFLDPLNDLFNNQYGLHTQFFGVIPKYKTVQREHPELIQFSDSQLRQMDKDMGIQKYGIYISDMFAILRQEMKVRARVCKTFGIGYKDIYGLTKMKLEFIKNELINIGKVPGLFERMIMYKFIREQVLDKNEKACTDIIFTSRNPEETKLHIIMDYPGYGQEVYEEKKNGHGQFYLDRIK